MFQFPLNFLDSNSIGIFVERFPIVKGITWKTQVLEVYYGNIIVLCYKSDWMESKRLTSS